MRNVQENIIEERKSPSKRLVDILPKAEDPGFESLEQECIRDCR